MGNSFPSFTGKHHQFMLIRLKRSLFSISDQVTGSFHLDQLVVLLGVNTAKTSPFLRQVRMVFHSSQSNPKKLQSYAVTQEVKASPGPITSQSSGMSLHMTPPELQSNKDFMLSMLQMDTLRKNRSESSLNALTE